MLKLTRRIGHLRLHSNSSSLVQTGMNLMIVLTKSCFVFFMVSLPCFGDDVYTVLGQQEIKNSWGWTVSTMYQAFLKSVQNLIFVPLLINMEESQHLPQIPSGQSCKKAESFRPCSSSPHRCCSACNRMSEANALVSQGYTNILIYQVSSQQPKLQFQKYQ